MMDKVSDAIERRWEGGFRLTVGRKVSEGEGCLALDLETRAVHEHDQALHKLRLGRSELLPVGG